VIGRAFVRSGGRVRAGCDRPAGAAGRPVTARENQRVSRTLLTGPTRPILTRSLAGLIETRLVALARKAPTCPIVPDALAAMHLAAGQLALIENWLTLQHACRPEVIAQALFVSTNAAAAALYRRVMPSTPAPAGPSISGIPD